MVEQATEGLKWPVGPRHTIAKTRVLSPEEITQFNNTGVLSLKQAFPRDDANRLEDEWWAEFQDLYGIHRHDPSTWRQPGSELLGAKISPSQARIASNRLIGAIDDLMGPGAWSLPGDWGRVVTTFPNCAPGDWDIPRELWNWQMPASHRPERMNSLILVMCISPVQPRGGAEMVVSGSYRLMLKYYAARRSAGRAKTAADQKRAFLSWHPWLAGLTGQSGPRDRVKAFLEASCDVHGVPVKVVELTGEPGDAYLIHPYTMIAPSANSLDVPHFVRIKQPLLSRAARAKRPGRIRHGDPEKLRL